MELKMVLKYLGLLKLELLKQKALINLLSFFIFIEKLFQVYQKDYFSFILVYVFNITLKYKMLQLWFSFRKEKLLKLPLN